MIVVDPMNPCARNEKWRYDAACHLFATDPEELHTFAKRLGLKREWAQNEGKHSLHYDLNESMRTYAVALGATGLTDEEFNVWYKRHVIWQRNGGEPIATYDELREIVEGDPLRRKGTESDE